MGSSSYACFHAETMICYLWKILGIDGTSRTVNKYNRVKLIHIWQWWVSDKRHELPTLGEHRDSHHGFWWGLCCSSFGYLYCVLFLFFCLFVCLMWCFFWWRGVWLLCFVFLRHVSFVSGVAIVSGLSIFLIALLFSLMFIYF